MKTLGGLNCPRCKSPVNASNKFCGNCGRRIGFGARSENEIRSAINELKTCRLDVPQPMRQAIHLDIELMCHVLNWTLGEEPLAPMKMVLQGIEEHNRMRINNDDTMRGGGE